MESSQSHDDSEKGHSREINSYGGYERLGHLMGQVPNTAIFRRFGALSAQSLLHLQAQLCDLEQDLQRQQTLDRQAGQETDRSQYDFSSGALRDSVLGQCDPDTEDEGYGGGEGPGANDPRQWELMLRIRDILKEYYEQLARHNQIFNLKSPSKAQLKDLQEWMQRESRGNMKLIGLDADIWTECEREELVSMAPLVPEGATPSPSTMKLLNIYHGLIGRHVHKQEKDQDHLRNSVVYKDDGVAKVVRGLKTLVACMLPIVGIVVLYLVDNMPARLGIVAGFTAMFSLVLCFFTTASIKDIFSATAAFSAVLVVFVGTTN